MTILACMVVEKLLKKNFIIRSMEGKKNEKICSKYGRKEN